MCYQHQIQGCCNTCFCFKDVKRATVAIGMFSLMTSLVQILVTVAVFTGFNQNQPIYLTTSTANTTGTANTTTYILYIALSASDFLVVLFSFVLLYGNERTDDNKAKTYFWPWLIFIPLYVIYESAINIYYFYNQLNNLYSAPLSAPSLGFSIVPIVYWGIKDILLFFSFVFLANRVHALMSMTPKFQPFQSQYAYGRGITPQPAAVVDMPASSYNVSCPPSRNSGVCGGVVSQEPIYGYSGAQNIGEGWSRSVFQTPNCR